MLVGGGLAWPAPSSRRCCATRWPTRTSSARPRARRLGATLGIAGAARSLPALAIGAGSSLARARAWCSCLAFVGGLGTVLLVYARGARGGRVPVGDAAADRVRRLVGPGGRASALLMFVSGRALAAIFGWLMGSLAGARLGRPRLRGARCCAISFVAPLRRAGGASTCSCWGMGRPAHLGVDVEREKLRADHARHPGDVGRGRHLGHHRLRRPGGAAPAAPGDRPRSSAAAAGQRPVSGRAAGAGRPRRAARRRHPGRGRDRPDRRAVLPVAAAPLACVRADARA